MLDISIDGHSMSCTVTRVRHSKLAVTAQEFHSMSLPVPRGWLRRHAWPGSHYVSRAVFAQIGYNPSWGRAFPTGAWPTLYGWRQRNIPIFQFNAN